MWQLAFYLAVAVIQYLMYEPPPGPKAASLEDFSTPKSNEGDPIYDFGGTVWIKDAHVIWFGDFRSRGIYKKGGKK